MDEVVANAWTIVPEADKSKRNIFRQWVYLAERELGYSANEIKTTGKLDVEDFIIVKPEDFISGIDLVLMDSSGSSYRYLYKGRGERIHPRPSDISDRERDYIKLSEDQHAYYLSSNATNIECAKLKYYGLPLDEDGELQIPEHHLIPIMMFIKYMFSLSNEQRNYNVEPHYNRWLIERAKAKGKNKMPSMLEGQQIASQWMSLIDKFTKRDY